MALVGKRDEPTDGVADYCAWLGEALTPCGYELQTFRVRWPELGWNAALAELDEISKQWRGCWVLLQYTVLAWSRRGFPGRVPGIVSALKKNGARCGVVFHDFNPFPGDRIIDRVRRAYQARILSRIYQLVDLASFTVPLDKVAWAPSNDRKAVFIPVGANCPEPAAFPSPAAEGLLEYVRRKQAYHFVIDRFGRVFSVVREGDYANHAGHSVWADQNWVYLNLNQSFFGVAFEATSRPGDGPAVNAAQVHAGRILVEMLRARYQIAAANCVAHAQVSVNPINRRAGYHTDWATNLPFHDLGLSDNYQLPLPSVTLFGFTGDDALAESQVRRDAVARGMPLERYRQILQRRYQDAIASIGRQTSMGRQTNVKYE